MLARTLLSGGMFQNFRWVLKLVCLHVILRPELLFYFMSVQVSLEKVGFSLKIKEIS